MISRNGLLLVMMEPPAALEEEFQAWYDTEHIPERAALPGFRTALRFVALSGYPRFLAVYDLDSPEVLESPEYLAVSGNNFSPWTKRITSRVHVLRIVGEQIHPGAAATERTARLLLLRLRDLGGAAPEEVVAAVEKGFAGGPGTASVRVFVSRSQPRVDYWAMIGLSADAGEPALSRLGTFGRAVDLVNLYAPRDLQ